MPYRSPGIGDDRVDWILQQVNQAQATLDARVAEAQALPDTEPSKAARITRLNQMKREIDTVYGDLDKSVQTWADRDIRSFYRRGHDTAAAQLGTGFTFTLPHKEAIDLISFDAYDDVATRLLQVRQGFSANIELQKMYEGLDVSQIQAIQQQARSAVNQMLLTGEDPRKIAKVLAQDLWTQGVQIIDAGGRQWNPEAYTRMLVRTKSANAYNAGSLNKYVEQNVERVRVFDGVEDDQECATANGEIWAIDYAMENVIAHPNCRRAFGPEVGKGSVDRKNPVSKAVVFDRIETASTALVALRSFRRTGQINVSATLARFVTESIELATGLPLPLIDNFVMHAVGQGFREADAWVESFIDPILFAAGFIKEIPTRAQIIAIDNPNGYRTLIDETAQAISRLRYQETGTYRPVGQLLNQLNAMADEADAVIDRIVGPARDNPIPWIDVFVNRVSPVNRLGQIVGETFVVLKNEEIDDLKLAWEEARRYVDDMNALRLAHQRMLRNEYDAALEELNRYAEARSRIRVLLIRDQPIDTSEIDDLLAPFLATEGLSIPVTRAHLVSLDEELQQLHWSAFKRVNETRDLARGRSRVLTFPDTAGPDIPGEVGAYWDSTEVYEAARDLQRRLFETADNGVPQLDINLISDVGEALVKLSRDPAAADEIFLQISGGVDVDEFVRWFKTRADAGLFQRMVDAKVIDEVAGTVKKDKFVYELGRDLQALGFSKGQVTWGGEELLLLPAIQDRVVDAIEWSRHAFYNQIMVDLNPTVFTKIKTRIADGTSVDVLWNRTADTVRVRESAIAQIDDLNSSTLGRWLSLNYTGFKRTKSGINGTNYLIDTEDGQTLFVKVFEHYGGLLGEPESATSQLLASSLAEYLGNIEAPPGVLFSTKRGDLWGMVFPGIPADELSDTGYVLRSDQARRHSFFDLITGELDGHRRNYMVDQTTDVVFHIDMEAGFFKVGQAGDRWDRGVASKELDQLLREAWGDGDDLTHLGLDPDVRLVDLTEAEAQFLINAAQDQYNSPVVWVAGQPKLVAGRMGTYDYAIPDGYGAYGPPKWRPTYYLTDSELEFVEMDLDDKIELFREFIEDQFSALPDDLISVWAANRGVSDLFGLSDDLALEAATAVQRRIDRMIDGGLINISGGLKEYTNHNGVRVVVGDKLEWVLPDGTDGFGTVVNIIEDVQGRLFAQVANGVGFGKPKEVLEGLTAIRSVPIGDMRVPDAPPSIGTFVDELRVSIAQATDLGDLDDTLDRTVLVMEVNDAGLLLPVRKQQTQIDNFAGEWGGIYVKKDRFVVNSTLPGEVAERLTEIVESEIRLQDELGRPIRVVIGTGAYETSDGLRALGVYDADKRTMYVSAHGLYPAVKGDVRRLVFENREDMVDLADFEAFRKVVRHELGHSNAVGRELLLRNKFSAAVLEQIADTDGITTLEDFKRFALAELKAAGRLDLIDEDNALKNLVEFRTSVLMDVVNSNRVEAAAQMLEKGRARIPDRISPAIVEKVIRRESDAYQELLAEILTTNTSAEWWASANGLDVDLAIVLDQGLSQLPTRWYGEEFVQYLDYRLIDGARLVPLRTSANREFWSETGINTKRLVELARPDDGGFTWDIITEEQPRVGFSVAIRENERVIENFSSYTDDEVAQLFREYEAEHRHLLVNHTEWKLGGWHDKKADRFVLDTSRVIPDEVSAARFAFDEQQEEIFDLKTFKTKKAITKYATFEEYVAAEIPDYAELKPGLVDVLQSKNKSRTSFATDVLGRFLPLSLKSLPKKKADELLEKLALREIYVRDTGEVVDWSRETMKQRYIRVLERAVKEYEENPLLRADHRFYEIWNRDFRLLSAETGVPLKRIVGAAAAMSPGVLDTENKAIAIFMTRKLAADKPLTKKEVARAKKDLQKLVKDYRDKYDKPERAAEFQDWADRLEEGVLLSSMETPLANKVMASMRRLELLEAGESARGFPARSQLQFEQAVAIIRNEMDVQDALGDTKVRSFYNNILDPFDVVGQRDVTIDYHMVDSALGGSTNSGKTVKGVEPKIDKLAWGMRVILADLVRELYDEGWGVDVGAESVAQLQEVIWHTWRDGKDHAWWGEIQILKERIR